MKKFLKYAPFAGMAAIYLLGVWFFLLSVPSENRLPLFVFFVLIGICLFLTGFWLLNRRPINIKDKRAGYGQHGKAEWMDEPLKQKNIHNGTKRKRIRTGLCAWF